MNMRYLNPAIIIYRTQNRHVFPSQACRILLGQMDRHRQAMIGFWNCCSLVLLTTYRLYHHRRRRRRRRRRRHHQLNVHFLPRLNKGMDGCFPTALGRQSSTFSNILGPLV